MTSLILAAALTLQVPSAPWKDGAKVADTDENVTGGINWQDLSGLCCAKYDEGGNILMNPSFESGDRYLQVSWSDVAERMSESFTNEARSGRCAFVAKRGSCGQLSQLVLKANTDYTVSCYVKLEKAAKFRLSFHARGPISEASPASLVSAENGGIVPAGEWTRLSGKFRTPANMNECVGWLAHWGQGTVILDDFQIEEGELTPYRGNPFGLDIRLDSLEAVYCDASKDAHPRLALSGPKGAKGRVTGEVVDTFGRTVAAFDEAFAQDGETDFEIAFDDAQLPKGVLVARVKVAPEGGHAFTDYVRWAKFNYLDNRFRHKNKMCISQWQGSVERNPRYESIYRRMMHFGFGAFEYTGCWDESDRNTERRFEYLPGERDFAVAEKYGVEFFGANFGTGSAGRSWLNGDSGERWKKRIRFRAYTPSDEQYPEDYLEWVRTNVCAVAKRHPRILNWTLATEPDHGSQAQRDAYVKYIFAVLDGLKEGNPKATLMPYGAYNMAQQGRSSVLDMMRRLKAANPKAAELFDLIEIHTYRSYPEFPDVERDLKAFIDGLAAAGYPDISIKTGEGSYYYPMWRRDGVISTFWGVGKKDAYSKIRIPTYDLGWGERIGAAQTLRETAVYYKYGDKVTVNCSWSPRFADGVRPFAWVVANAALGKMLGDSAFVKDVRIGRWSRAYVFDDGHGSAVALVWKGDQAFDRGEESGTTLTFGRAVRDLQTFDMMGNLCETADTIPLSGFPIYLKAPKGETDALIAALENARLPPGSDREPVAYPVREITVHRTEGRPDWSRIAGWPIRELKPSGMGRTKEKWGGPDDFSASMKLAYDPENLYLRVEVRDDKLTWREPPPKDWMWQYKWDAVQLYFDGLGNAKESAGLGNFGYDMDDFSYELLPSNATTAVVYRRLAQDHQYTGGALVPYLSNTLEPGIRCDIVPMSGGYAYEVAFPKEFIRPLPLDGSVRPGFSIEIYDRDTMEYLVDGKLDFGNVHAAQWYLSDIPENKRPDGTVDKAFSSPHLYSTLVFEK